MDTRLPAEYPSPASFIGRATHYLADAPDAPTALRITHAAMNLITLSRGDAFTRCSAATTGAITDIIDDLLDIADAVDRERRPTSREQPKSWFSRLWRRK